MSAAVSYYDNAFIKSSFGTVKSELGTHGIFEQFGSHPRIDGVYPILKCGTSFVAALRDADGISSSTIGPEIREWTVRETRSTPP
jgi:hypothetical protein